MGFTGSTLLKFGGIVALLAVLISVINKNENQDFNAEIPQVLKSLRNAENEFRMSKPPQVALGFAGCIDIFVDAVSFMKAAKISVPDSPKHHESTSNKVELAEIFAYFFEESAAATRKMSDTALYQELVEIAESLPGSRISLGCVAPIMGNLFAKEGAKVLVGAQIDPKYKTFLNPGVKVVGVDGAEKNDIHIIMEYKTGDKWGKFKAARANRYVIHSDFFNPNVYGLEPLLNSYKEFNPNLVVIGDLQAMNHFPYKSGERKAKLSSIKDFLMETSQQEILNHFEFASYVDESLLQDLKENILPHVHSIGMNEQELPNLLSVVRFGNVTQVSDAHPCGGKVLDQLRMTYKLIRQESGQLSRIHIHTLAFQAILTRRQSPWKHSKAAAAHASLTGSRYISGVDKVRVETSKLLMDESLSTSLDEHVAKQIFFNPLEPISCWEENVSEDEVSICVAPNLVCTDVKQTCGAGDHISAAGLMYQI